MISTAAHTYFKFPVTPKECTKAVYILTCRVFYKTEKNESARFILELIASASSQASGETAHSSSLIRAFVVRIHKDVKLIKSQTKKRSVALLDSCACVFKGTICTYVISTFSPWDGRYVFAELQKFFFLHFCIYFV